MKAATLLSWYHKNKRDLPWRRTKDPYRIWLSEIILQQTRVDQGLSYYNRFVLAYPDVKKLASAKEDAVLRLWQGLGYYSRARNLHWSAKEIVKKHHGIFPTEFQEIRSLKGIGDYTAGAISSFAFNKKYAAVDGNVARVLSRYLGIRTPVDTSAARKNLADAVLQLMDDANPGDFNQAMIELGALQCKPQNPDCSSCPLRDSCYAYANRCADSIPVKAQKIKIRKRYFNYLFIRHRNKVHVRKRTSEDIWKNLYDFPLIETDRQVSFEKLAASPAWKLRFAGKKMKVVTAGKTIRHQLSHQTIHARFIEINADALIFPDTKQVTISALDKYAKPRLIENFLNGLGSSGE